MVGYIVCHMPPPNRHHNCIHELAKVCEGKRVPAGHTQGFMTDTGRFVDRFEGLRIAEAAGQLIRKTPPEDRLFSEDLW